MDPAEVYLLALKLSLLTFYLGVLIYSLPLPLRSVKRWGPELIVDSLFAFTIVVAHGALFIASERLAVALGGSKALFADWFSGAMLMAVGVKTLVNVVDMLPSKIVISPALQAIAIPFDRMATLAIAFLTTLSAIAVLVFEYGTKLLLLGVVLYAIPFKVAKNAGAWLISFILVFTVGLQVLPLFLLSISSPPEELEQIDYRTVTVRAVSAHGHPAAGGILRFEKKDLFVSHELDKEGYASSPYLAERTIALPAETLMPSLAFGGYIFPLHPSPFDVRSRAGDLVVFEAPHVILFKEPSTLIFVSTLTNHSLEVRENAYVARAWLERGDRIEVRVPEGCSHEVRGNGTLVVGESRWRGVDLKVYSLRAEREGWYEVRLAVSPCQLSLEPVETHDYMRELLKKLHYIDWNLMRGFILYYLTVPAMYVFMLFLITTGAAYLLGGRDKIPIKVA
ncbi:MAG: hypothetical protein NZ902_02485 [Acidilobaceae archaeon]|nr:hypothetical protein [Acidilobaceae archaeon]MCX8165687.1 hypothetical protein [Acidilobaceae archaeon]MDW7974112.1 hypothetical protein [Sulfolobales archaeon]